MTATAKPAFLRLDGSLILTEDLQAAIDWYRQHLGLTLAWDSPDEQLALLLFPNEVFSLALRTAPDDIIGDLVPDPRVFLTLGSPNLQATQAKLRAEGIVCTDLYQAPGGDAMFDFFDLNGLRLTAVSMNSLQDVEPALYALAQETPDAPFVCYVPPRIGVRDLTAACRWYHEHLGLDTLFQAPSEGLALLAWPASCPLWLEQLPAEHFDGPEHTAARPYLLTENIEATCRYFQALGCEVSAITGDIHQLRTAYTYDPDGNQIHFWSYPDA